MKIIKSILEKNACFLTNKYMQPSGIMIHSTGANNPRLNRYCIIPNEKISMNNWNTYTPDGRQVCPHAFVGKLVDGSVAVCQTLPWDIVGWHSGVGVNGSANKLGYIGIEMCEGNLSDVDYFNRIYDVTVDLCVNLCRQYNIDPLTSIICHAEGYRRGIASNHADVEHWFCKHNKTMDDFRRDVNGRLLFNDYTDSEQWCIENKIFVGDGRGNYNFDKPMTRGQVATVLKKLYDLIKR